MSPDPTTPAVPGSQVQAMSVPALVSALNALNGAGGPYALALTTTPMTAIDGLHTFDRDQANTQQQINGRNEYLQNAGVGFDPQTITGADPFFDMPATQIADNVTAMKPADLQMIVNAWNSIGGDLSTAAFTLGLSLSKAFDDAWHGDAADKARKACHEFAGDGFRLGSAVTQVGGKLQFAQRGVDETYRLIFPLVGVLRQGPSLATSLPLGVLQAGAQQQSNPTAQEQALHTARVILSTVYTHGIMGGDQGVPTLPEIKPVGNDNPPNPNPLRNPAGPPSAASPSGPSGPDQQPSSPDTQQPGEQQQQPSQQPSQPTSQSDKPTGSTTPKPSGMDPSKVHAASVDPTGGLGPAGPGGLGGGGLGGGLGGSLDGPNTPSSLGAPNLGATNAADVSNRAGSAAARPGSAGTPGMGHPQAGKKGGEDKPHKTADYLRGTHHMESWLADDRRALPAFGMPGDWAAHEKPFDAKQAGPSNTAAAKPDENTQQPDESKQA